MKNRVELTFKNNEDEKELFQFLQIKGKIIGKSAYIKQLLTEEMMKEKALKTKF